MRLSTRVGDRRFDLNKYIGKWYELAHTPSWFQHNDDYNTTATYTPLADGTMNVTNTTINKGREVTSVGTATQVGNTQFVVEFSTNEIAKLVSMKSYTYDGKMSHGVPNYVVVSVWKDNKTFDYKYAIVTDNDGKAVYVLSRTPCPPANEYAMLMKYVAVNFDMSTIVQTPHYM